MSDVGISALYHLAPLQHGMLFNHRLDPRSGVDIEQLVCSLPEPIEAYLLRDAWQSVVECYPTLRTAFVWEGVETPQQEGHSNVVVPFENHDVRALSCAEREEQFQDFLEADRVRGFDLRTPPLMRLALFQFGSSDFRLVWTFHHIVADGRSHAIVLQDAFETYERLTHGEDPGQDREESVPYREFIEFFDRRDPSLSQGFWRELLDGITSPTSLDLAPPSGGAVEFSGRTSRQDMSLDESVTAELCRIAETNGVTLNTLFQGAWAILLSRYCGAGDVVFGAIRARRHGTVPNAGSMVGLFINTLPVRVRVSSDAQLLPWLQELRGQHLAVRDHEHSALVDIQGLSDIPHGTPLFESIVVFDNYRLGQRMQRLGGKWEKRDFELLEDTGYPLSVYGYGDTELTVKIDYDNRRFGEAAIRRMLAHFKTLLEGFRDLDRRISDISVLGAEETRQLLVDWNQTEVDCPRDVCVHQLIESQAERTPDDAALVFGDTQLTYRELNSRANRLAHLLQGLGVGPDVLVGICVERSVDMLVGLLAVLKAGGAYVPLDPGYPRERTAYVLEDASLSVLLTQEKFVDALPETDGVVFCLDRDWDRVSGIIDTNPVSLASGSSLAYVIYTSGSTGKPKGVMVTHANVVNFFVGMDDCINHAPGQTWLAVTSISFDISVLELFWTLARGFRVVLQPDDVYSADPGAENGSSSNKKIDFSLFFFASDEEEDPEDKYRLLIESAKFADRHGFHAVWTPERHFHASGGLYPNPSVLSAALAAVTENVQLRAGSVVLPLHNSIRVAEEWSVVDNLSHGRVGIAFAAGWQRNDFVLKPENFADDKNVMFREVEVVRRLWRGESVTFDGPAGEVDVCTLPRPVQRELPVWITSAGNPDTYRQAGEIGANLLTHLLGQTLEDVAGKIAIYRQAWKDGGHEGEGHVTLMLHTFVHGDQERVRDLVREPMKSYLGNAMSLVRQAAWSFPAFSKIVESEADDFDGAFDSLSEEDLDALLEHAFERYYRTSGLFGSPGSCLDLVNKIKDFGVDEIGCLIDFGVPTDEALPALRHLDELRLRSNREEQEFESIPHLIVKHGVTHMQCTPSMARMLTVDEEGRAALGRLEHFLVGGEELAGDLASTLSELVHGTVTNMYGPTETTIWSSIYRLNGEPGVVPIGKPIANTQLYVLDRNLQPLPVGISGELYIGGDGVTNGYLNQVELTREKFVTNPLGDAPFSVLYRTGDLVRYREDGNIEFLGRMDYQVKIRGHRIELGEIEALLEEFEGVEGAVVLAREDVAGDKRLVAYLVGESSTSDEELNSYLEARLPEYMVPSGLTRLEAFPLTPNGKINRKALAAPPPRVADAVDQEVQPEGQIEEVITKIWNQVLNVEQIGVHQNFFDLGGHSLLTIQVQSRLCQQTGLELSLIDVFRFPTIRSLADHVTKKCSPESLAKKNQEWASARRDRLSRQRQLRKRLHSAQRE